MRTWKKFMSIAVGLCIMLTVLSIPNMKPAAKTKTSSQNVTITVNQVYNTSVVTVTYSNGGCQIRNIKSNSSNLLVNQTYQNWHNGSVNSDAWIGMYAKKAGKYKVTFDVCNAKNKTIVKHTINVTATEPGSNSPVKNASFAGKSNIWNSLTTKKSGKFKVTMNKGYKMKSITMETYNADGKSVEKKIKNNANVTLGKYAYLFEEEDGDSDDWSYFSSASVFATTAFIIQYQNTKTKQTGNVVYYLYKIPKN